MMLDTYFEGQRKAAIKTQQAGLTIVRMAAKNVPEVIKVDSNYWEKLFMEDCRFVNVKGPAISFDDEGNANMQINLRNVACQDVPVLVKYLKSNQVTTGPSSKYNIEEYVYGLQMNGLDSISRIETIFKTENLMELPPPMGSDVPSLPSMESWVNIKQMGAKGDGETDDTKIIQDAIKTYSTVYFPQGLYHITRTIKLKPNSVLIGLHPVATQFVLAESSESFSGFGAPKPMIEVPRGAPIL